MYEDRPNKTGIIMMGIFSIIVACITGSFLTINTLIEKDVFSINLTSPLISFQNESSDTATPIDVVAPNAPNNSVATSSLLSVQTPDNPTCQNHSSGYCGLAMTVSWSSIDADSDYYIYLFGHGTYYDPEIWWVAGSGIPINKSSGTWTITDGAYGNSGDSLSVFACLTKTKYSFTNSPKFEFKEYPDCEFYSEEIFFIPQ